MKTKPPSPIDEVGQLREELAQERANNRELLKRVDELNRRVASLQEQLDQTMKMLRRRDEQVKRLEWETADFGANRGSRTPRPNRSPTLPNPRNHRKSQVLQVLQTLWRWPLRIPR